MNGASAAVRFDAVSFSYGGISVLERASFHVHEGEFAVLLGPNGSGKTTALKLILGLLRPASGRVLVFGKDAEDGRAQVGYVPQAAAYDPAFPISVSRVVLTGRLKGLGWRYGGDDREAAARAMAAAAVADLADRPYAALSGGQRRRVLVARALAARPRLLVLDEPTSNMDAESEELLFRSLGALKGSSTVLVVTHDTGFVSALTDAVFCMGERGLRHGAIVRHPATADGESDSHNVLEGAVLRVHHETALPPDGCFEDEGDCGCGPAGADHGSAGARPGPADPDRGPAEGLR